MAMARDSLIHLYPRQLLNSEGGFFIVQSLVNRYYGTVVHIPPISDDMALSSAASFNLAMLEV
jgi:hypothetical protein